VTVATETDEPGADATARSARLRHLIFTVYGLYARHDGGWLSVATLIRLLADLGIDEPAVRSAISRLKRRGILQSRRHDGAAGYQLSAEALAILREGDVPAHPQDTTAETLRRLELDAYADLFRADHLAFGDPAAKVRQWWDLDELERHYESFIRAHEPALRALGSGPAGGPEAFAGYVRVLTDWRRLPYLDPGLPAELLPEGWVGIRAAELFFALRALLEEPARAYVTSVSR
jgi:phenylacetic acid degradation operon negative regulatory protein